MIFNMPFEFIIFIIGLVAIIIVIILKASPDMKNWHEDESKPKISTEARIVKKRKEGAIGRVGTTYMFNLNRLKYITFEIISSGERKEYSVPEDDYDKAIEGDLVDLILQGCRYSGFDRIKELKE